MSPSVFSRFAPRLRDAIVSRLGWRSLRPVQELAGHALLDGQNAVILAPTAGGKTEASMFPTLSSLLAAGEDGVGALYIAPIKALLNNQAERLGQYTEMVGLDRFVWHGDTASNAKKRFLHEPTSLLMTTPESLEVMLVSTRVDAAALFRNLRVVVIDEVHALAGSDRGGHLMSVLERIARLSDHDIQRVGLSATVGNPEAILTWLQGTSRREGCVVDPPKQPARRELLVLQRMDQEAIARDAVQLARGGKSLVFCQSRATTETIAQLMRRAGIAVFVHHSSVSAEEREEAEARFHGGGEACIVCTSTLELGIDVGDLDRVLQVDAPETVGSFLQRMGRTGRRAGQSANTTFLCEDREAVLQAVALIQMARRGWVEDVAVEDRRWTVLVHQLFAMALARGVSEAAFIAHVGRVPDTRGITPEEVRRLIAWQLDQGLLTRATGRLLLGPRAEKRYGRRNFMELYAVFESPQLYAVQTRNRRPLGSITQSFVDRLGEGRGQFLLAGRSWHVLEVDHSGRRVVVEPARRGRKPSWGGMLPRYLSGPLCQEIRAVLAAEDQPSFLHDSAQEVLATARDELQSLARQTRGGLELDDEEVRWWTFAGGRINTTLKYGLRTITGADWRIVAEDFCIKIRGSDGLNDVMQRIDELRAPGFWTDEQRWLDVTADLPAYRLSKFQDAMPDWVRREVVGRWLLDVEGARRSLLLGEG